MKQTVRNGTNQLMDNKARETEVRVSTITFGSDKQPPSLMIEAEQQSATVEETKHTK